MDGPLIAAIVTGSVAIGGALGGGFWRVSSCLGKQNKSIGRLEGKMDGVDARMTSYEKQLGGFDQRIGRLDKRLNGFVDDVGKRRTRRKKE